MMNEINNMSFLTADSKSKMTKVRLDVPVQHTAQQFTGHFIG